MSTPTRIASQGLAPLLGLAFALAPMAAPAADDRARALDAIFQSADASQAMAMETMADLIAYFEANPDRVAMVWYSPVHDVLDVSHNPTEAFPIGQLAYLAVTIELAEAVASGRLDQNERVALSELERYALRGADFGGDDEALVNWRRRGAIEGNPPTVPLIEVLRGMLRDDSTMCANYLHYRVGGTKKVLERTQSLGMQEMQPFGPLGGLHLLWGNHSTANIDPSESFRKLRAMPAMEVALRSEAMMHQYATDDSWREAERRWRSSPDNELPGLASFQFTRTSYPSASGRDVVTLLARIGAPEADQGISEGALKLLREELSWPIRIITANEVWSTVYTKRTMGPGFLASGGYYVAATGGYPAVGAILLRDLPPPVWTKMQSSGLLWDLENRMSIDPAFRAGIAARLQAGRDRRAVMEAEKAREARKAEASKATPTPAAGGS